MLCCTCNNELTKTSLFTISLLSMHSVLDIPYGNSFNTSVNTLVVRFLQSRSQVHAHTLSTDKIWERKYYFLSNIYDLSCVTNGRIVVQNSPDLVLERISLVSSYYEHHVYLEDLVCSDDPTR